MICGFHQMLTYSNMHMHLPDLHVREVRGIISAYWKKMTSSTMKEISEDYNILKLQELLIQSPMC